MQKKIKVNTINIDHWFESKKDIELYRRTFSPRFTYQGPPPSKSSKPSTLWLHEAVTYLGLDRIGIKRPDKAIHRLINKEALHPKKISGRLSFERAELDKVLANGDHKMGRGRPRKL